MVGGRAPVSVALPPATNSTKEIMTCDACKKDVHVCRWQERLWKCRSCAEKTEFSMVKHLWEDGSGSYGTGWLNDVKRRRVVGKGEVIRDYGRKYFV